MSEEQALRVDAAVAELRESETINDLLRTATRDITDLLGAEACSISRAIGELLIDLVDYAAGNYEPPVPPTHGYLISDYPLTREVLEQREPRTVFVGDPRADRNEVQLLRDIGFEALIMLALEQAGETWGLVEVYGRRPFGTDAVEIARRLAAETSNALSRFTRV